MSPLRPAEFVVALMVMSLIRLAVGVVPVTLMAIAFFGFNLWALGIAFAAFFIVLIFFAWSVGLLVSGILLRYGLGAENLVWSLMFIIEPLGCVYYSCGGSSQLAATHLLGLAADLCFRGPAPRADRPCSAR